MAIHDQDYISGVELPQLMQRVAAPDGKTTWIPIEPPIIEVELPRPETCRECVFCSEETDTEFSACCYHPGEVVRTAYSRPACHLGELRDEPWPEEPATSEVVSSHRMAYVIISEAYNHCNSKESDHWRGNAMKWMDQYRAITGYHDKHPEEKKSNDEETIRE